MAFNLELVKTKVADWVRTLEADLGPAVERVRDAFGTVLGQVHAEAVADERTIKDQVIGDVKTVEDAVSADAADPNPAATPTEPAAGATTEPATEPAPADAGAGDTEAK